MREGNSIRPAAAGRVVAASFAIIAWLLLPLLPAIAEDVRVLAGKALAFDSESSNPDLPAGQPPFSARKTGRASLALRLPGEAAESRFELVSEEEIEVPVFNEERRVVSRTRVTIQQATDFGDKTGLFVFAGEEAPVARKTFGMVISRAEAQPVLWEVTPLLSPHSTEVENPHTVTRTTAGELPALARCGLEHLPAAAPGAPPAPLPLLGDMAGDSSGLDPGPDADSATGKLSGPFERKDGRWRELQLIVVSPTDFTANRSDQQVVAQIAATIASANAYYQPLLVINKLVGVQVFRNAGADPYAAAVAQGDGRAMLDIATAQWGDRQEPEHDVVAVFAKSDFRRLFGLAFPATACLLPRFSVLFATEGGVTATSALGLVSTFAHELGHILGMNHDSTQRSEGPSLMWPFFVLDPNGFSELSLGEYDIHVAKGGNSCLSVIAPPDGSPGGSSGGGPSGGGPAGSVLGFEGGAHQEIAVAEGQALMRQLRVAGSDAQFNFTSNNLPAGASLNVLTGVLTYEPGFDVADAANPARRFRTVIEARNASQQATLSLDIVVTNSNRAPLIESGRGSVVELEEGAALLLPLAGRDADAGDAVSLGLLNASAVRRYPGRPAANLSGAVGAISWLAPPGSRGRYEFRFSAVDSAGAVAVRSIFVDIVPANAPPLIDSPDATNGLIGQVLQIPIRASDPEGTPVLFDFLGLPPGAVLRYEPGGVTVHLRPQEGKEQSFAFQVSASDGKKTSRKTITVNLAAGLSKLPLPELPWPRSGLPQLGDGFVSDYNGDGRDELTLYLPASGEWLHLDCGGSQLSRAQFGGLLSDLPLSFKRFGKANRALYRTVGEQGYWVIENADRSEVVPWGLKGDIPIAADFDGDGQSDYAVYRPNGAVPGGGQWHILFTSMPPQVLSDTALGADSSRAFAPAAADVDGDGIDDRLIFSRKTDGTAVFHAWLANGERWAFVAGKVDQFSAVSPLIADLDGDGRADFSVRSAAGTLQSLLSESGELHVGGGLRAVDALSSVHCGSGEGGLGILSRGALVAGVSSARQSLTLQSVVDTAAAASIPTAVVSGATTLESAHFLRALAASTGPVNDSDGDRRSDIAVFRSDKFQTTGQWFEQNALGAGVLYQPLIIGAGRPQAGSYRAGGPSALGYYFDGLWQNQNRNQELQSVTWGTIGDQAVPADYNGDGKPEIAIFRPFDASWWILYQGAPGVPDAARMQHWGERGDVPVPADYDGDGSAELAVWRPSTGQWFMLFQDGSVVVEQWGLSDDIPLPGDYLGSGRAQLAVYRPSEGLWLIRDALAANGDEGTPRITVQQWGLPSDIPLGGDYDGDGRQDLAVWRPAEGNWYILSLDSFGNRLRIVQFGLPGDQPLGGKKDDLLL